MTFPDSITAFATVSLPPLTMYEQSKVLENFESLLRAGGFVDKYHSPSETLFLRLSSEEKAAEIDQLAGLFLILSDFECDNIKKIYNYLFYLFPYFKEQDIARFFNESLTPGGSSAPPFQKLINYAPALKDQQRDLSLFLALWHKRQAALVPIEQRLIFYSEAMHYFATASNIAKTQGGIALVEEITLSASNILIKIAETHAESFEEKLERAGRGGRHEDVAELFMHVDSLKRLCVQKKDQVLPQRFYNCFIRVATAFSSTLQEKYAQHIRSAQRALAIPHELSPQTPLERYTQQLQTYRASFKCFLTDKPHVRGFQKRVTEQLFAFVQDILADTFAILGPPPCHYDIRAMGSIAREEATPFSDLELMILVEKEEVRPYFKQLVKILNLQIISLGETASPKLTFTCLHAKNSSGFHIDFNVNPDQDPDLMGTPEQLSKHQKNLAEPGTAAQMVRTSLSLHRNEPLDSLFQQYQSGMRAIFDAPEERPTRHTLAFHILKIRLEDYHKTWVVPTIPPIFNLKTHYIQPLHLSLADIGLYFKIEATNTIDIVDGLFQAKIFTKETADLIKEALSFTYQMRIRTHDFYGEQRDDLCTDPNAAMNCRMLSLEEKGQLEKIYWLVLRPLYQCLAKGLSTETSALPLLDPSHVRISDSTPIYPLDFPDIVFKELLSVTTDHQFFSPIIPHLVACLYARGDLIEKFEKLSSRFELEEFRRLFFIESQKCADPTTVIILAKIPNPAGYRFQCVTNVQRMDILLDPSHGIISRTITRASITDLSGKQKYLSEACIKKLFEADGHICREYVSRHPVAHFRGLHFKEKPTHPGIEWAIYDLAMRIGGQRSPYGELFALEIRNTAGNVEKYPVLITETIEGDTLREIPNAVDRLISNGVANDSLSWLLILSILTKPGDGRHSNYLVNSSEDIFCVDNENSFVEPLCRGKLWNSLQFSTVLFGKVVFLSQTVLQAFASLNIDLILDEWVNDLIKKEAQLHALFPPILEGGRPLRASFKPVDVQRFYEQNPEDSFTSSILLREGTVLGLHLQFWHLQKFIKEKLQQEKSISSDELLQEMISVRDGGWKNRIGPDVHRLYHKGQKQKGMAPSQSSSQAHRAVFGKVPSFEEIAKKELFSPAKAKAELLGSILDVSHVFGKDTKPHDRIDMDFAEMDATRANLIIDTLISILTAATQKPKHLVFRGASHLTSKQLSNFLHPGLISLRLTGSANIREKDLLNVAKICASLEELYIEEVPLTKLGPIEFPRLEHCLIARMPFLTSLSLKAPCLVRLDISENPGMRTLRLGCERFPLIELESTPLTDFPSLESVSNQLFTHMELLLTKGKLEALASSLGLSLPVVPPPPNPHTLEEFANARHLYKKILSVYEEGSPSLKKQIDIELLLKTLGYILRKLNDYDFALQELVEARLCQTVADQAMQDSSAKEAEQRILAEEVFNTWNQEVIKKSTTFVENVRAAWKVSLGEIDPPYPPSREIDQILDAPCSMIEGKTIRETHKLIWVPKTVNGQPLTLRLLISLMEERDYRKGNPYTIWEKLGEFLDEPILNSYWMIMAPHPFPRSLGQNRAFFSQWEATDQGKVYRPTKIIEAAIAFAMSRYYYTDWVFFFKYGVACLEEYKYSLGSLVKDYLHYTVVLGPPNERNLIRGVPFEAGQKDVGLLGVIRLDKMGGGISKMSDVSA